MKCTPRPNQKAGDAMKGMVRFKQFYRLVHVGQGIEIREIGSRIGYHFPRNLVKDLSLNQGNWELTMKKMKLANLNFLYLQLSKLLFWLECAGDLCSFQKIVTLGQEGILEFSLVQVKKKSADSTILDKIKWKIQTPPSSPNQRWEIDTFCPSLLGFMWVCCLCSILSVQDCRSVVG